MKVQAIGQKRHRVTLEAPTADVGNTYGEKVPAWSAVAERWASIEPLTGRELWNAQQIQADVSTIVTIRHHRDVAANWRVNYKGRLLNIVFVKNVEERNREMQLYCQEFQN